MRSRAETVRNSRASCGDDARPRRVPQIREIGAGGTGPPRFDQLLRRVRANSGWQLPADDTIEQQVGAVAQDSRANRWNAIPAMDGMITAVSGPRCGVRRFSTRIAESVR
jgi:hypothetical protein